MKGEGFLAIWSDVAAADETDYLHWMTREHAAERLSVPGFLAVRLFKAQDLAASRFFILYDLATPAVLDGRDYLARLNAPSAWTRRVMPRLGNFIRGGGRRVRSAGKGSGGVVAALADFGSDRARAISVLTACDRVAAVHHLETDAARTGVRTAEKAMRTGDDFFRDLLLVEALDRAALREALGRLGGLGRDAPVAYAHLFGMEAGAAPAGG